MGIRQTYPIYKLITLLPVKQPEGVFTPIVMATIDEASNPRGRHQPALKISLIYEK